MALPEYLHHAEARLYLRQHFRWELERGCLGVGKTPYCLSITRMIDALAANSMKLMLFSGIP